LDKVKQRLPKLDEKRMKNVAFVEHLDHNIGQVLSALRETQLAQQTLVVFTSDNGGSLPHGQNNDPWRDGKQSHYDGGLRVPFVASWPENIKSGTRSDYAGLTFDLFPTLLELAGRPRSTDLDAISLAPVLRGETTPTARDLYFVRREGGPEYGGKSYEALIRGDWKLMQNSPFSPYELYNLKDDPYEKINLATTNKKVVNDLSASLRRHIQRGGSVPWQGPISKALPAH
jgi:arylsulfatase A-like enzyme